MAVRLLVDGRESVRAARADPTTHLEAAQQPCPDHATSPTRSGFGGFVRRSKGEIVFVGSSTIQRWDTAHYFPDFRIINRGISGTELSDALRYIDRLVLRYEPRLVVVYAGDNDIGGGTISEQIAVDFERFVHAVQARLPHTRILYIGIKPSPLRWLQVDRMRAANDIIRAICQRDDRLAFLDFDNLMLGWDEKPRRDLYVEDGLHLSPLGYQVWTAVLKPYLIP